MTLKLKWPLIALPCLTLALSCTEETPDTGFWGYYNKPNKNHYIFQVKDSYCVNDKEDKIPHNFMSYLELNFIGQALNSTQMPIANSPATLFSQLSYAEEDYLLDPALFLYEEQLSYDENNLFASSFFSDQNGFVKSSSTAKELTLTQVNGFSKSSTQANFRSLALDLGNVVLSGGSTSGTTETNSSFTIKSYGAAIPITLPPYRLTLNGEIFSEGNIYPLSEQVESLKVYTLDKNVRALYPTVVYQKGNKYVESLEQLFNITPNVENIEGFCSGLNKKSDLRKLIAEWDKSEYFSYEGGDDYIFFDFTDEFGEMIGDSALKTSKPLFTRDGINYNVESCIQFFKKLVKYSNCQNNYSYNGISTLKI
jgi:hypothetical protein